ncbi:MAG: hypothetical protein V2B18_15555, partial [Pseudomonadota bacterium]
MIRIKALMLAAVLCALFAAEFGWAQSQASDEEVIKLTCSRYTFFQATDLGRWFEERRPGVKVVVTYQDQSDHFHAITQGSCDALVTLGGLDPEVKTEVKEVGGNLEEQTVGWGGIVLV